MGKSWKPINNGLHIKKVWTAEFDPEERSRIYAGTHYGHLFVSNDSGKSWEECSGLHNTPNRQEWGIDWGYRTTGLCIHTILINPEKTKRILIVPAGNVVYGTEDYGVTWDLLQKGVMDSCTIFESSNKTEIPGKIKEDTLSEHLSQVHKCTRKLTVLRNPSSVFQQNHCGVYFSDDFGKSWKDMSPSKETRHGFGITSDRKRDIVYTIPARQGICSQHNSCIKGKISVYRTKNRKWSKHDNGLPRKVHTFILRDALSNDGMDSCGIYFGTTTGSVFMSKDEGETWSNVANGLGRIQGVYVLYEE